MNDLRGLISYVFVCIGIVVVHIQRVHTEVFTVSACHDSSQNSCNKMSLECGNNELIRLLTMKYGVKTSNCGSRSNQCLRASRSGCCVYADSDCTEYFNSLHAYNLHKQCSGQQTCSDVTVPNKMLTTCNNEVSTYVEVSYECVSEDSIISFCGGVGFGNDKNLLFTSDSSTLNGPASCQCSIASATGVIVEYVDVRMFKQNDLSWASDCSSASLISVPNSSVNTTCETSANEHDNFVYGKSWIGPSIVVIELEHLRRQGNDDEPQLVWLNVIGTEQVSMSVTCTTITDLFTTTPIASVTNPSRTLGPSVTTSAGGGLPVTTSAGTTDSNSSKIEDEDSNTGAIVAGVLVPIILLIIICVVLFFIWRKRGLPWKLKFQKSHSAPPNSYLDGADIENSCANDEYAEIGFVPDQHHTATPCYDTVYEPGNKQQLNGRNSTVNPTYANTVNANGTDVNIVHRNPNDANRKSVFNRIIGFFKKQNETGFPPVKSRARPSLETSGDPYDHLRPTSGIQIELVPEQTDPQHTYSHTKDIKKQVNSTTNDIKHQRQVKNSTVGVDHDEINAVHVGDAYIEFQVGPIDSNHPNLVKSPNLETAGTERPAPPTRPPPSPGMGKKDNSSQNLQVAGTKDMINRSPSPNFLSPDKAGSRSASPVDSISSHHTYKILEPHQIYDYADVSDDELGIAPNPPDDIYEDVDGKKVSVRKRPTRLPSEDNQYLEPITSKSSATLEAIKDTGEKTKNDSPKSQSSMLKRELKQKMGEKHISKPSDTKPSYVNSGAVDKVAVDKTKAKSNESDLENKDTPSGNGVKGVLGMARMFESGDTKNANLAQRNAGRTSSDA
ncbi:hypothetical protein ACF0H5_008095 [Mactra antiquata]